MSGLPKPILGEITAFTITTPDLETSLAYYRRLGFSEVMRADWPFPWIQVSDGIVLIMLRKDPKPYIALTYYVKKLDKVVNDLVKKGIEFVQQPQKTDAVKRYLFSSPDGLNISLVGIIDGFSQPAGPGMLSMPKEDYLTPEKYVNKTCGLYGELAHPVTDLGQSIAYWKLLGFEPLSQFASPYPWAILSDGLSIIGLHQSTHFDYAAITYFAADMKDKIERLKENGLTDYIEQGPSNAVLTTPEQQHIFLFSLGMPPKEAERKKPPVAFPTIETQRLLLKEVNPEIMKEIYATSTNEEIMSLLGIETQEELATEKNNFLLGMTTYRISYKSFLIIEKETGKIIGKCGFHNWYALHSRAELGYHIIHDSEKRKGYMTEAVKAVIRHGFEKMDLNRIEAFTGKENVASQRIIEKCGFTREGVLRSHYFKNGKIEDSVCFSLLRPEYDVIKSSWP